MTVTDLSIFDNIKGAANPTLNVEDFKLSPAEQEVYNNQYRPQSTGALNPTDYYPTMNSPINVGNYSGSVIGSTSLFAPEGALVPIGMMDARDAAIQKAALQKAKAAQDYQAELNKGPKTKLTGIREGLSEHYRNFISDSIEKATLANGGDRIAGLRALEINPVFQKKLKSYHDLGQRGDDIFDHSAKIDERIKSGEVMSPALRQSYDAMHKSMDPEGSEFQNFSQNYLRMNADREFQDAYNEATKNLVDNQLASAGINESDPDYLTIRETTTKQLGEDQKEAILNALKYQYQGSDLYSPEYIDKNGRALMNYQVKTNKLSVHNKPKDAGDIEDLNVSDISEEKGSLLGAVAQEGGQKREGNFTQLDGLTFKKPVDIVIPGSADATDMVTGKKMTDKNVRNATIGGIYNAYTYKGQIVDDEFMKDPAKAKLVKVVPTVTAIFKEKDADGKDIEVTGHIPLEQVKNSLRGKRNQNDKVLDEYFNRAKEKTSALQKSGSAPVTETQSKVFLNHKGVNYTKAQVEETAKQYGYTAEEYANWLKSQK